ncbi:MAG: hypothetical protein SFU91_05755 [Chloroherpetonaceae bacterium]|nr:hypothetical protein [Chloroherpetonaceae bacterium]
MRLSPTSLCRVFIFLLLVLIANKALFAQDSRPIEAKPTKTGPLISSSYPKAGAVVFASEVGELDIFSDPEPVDTRKRKEGRGKETKYVYTLFFEAEKPTRITLTPLNSLFENLELTLTFQEKIGQYYDVKLRSENMPPPIAVQPLAPAKEDPKDERKSIVFIEAAEVAGSEVKNGYGVLILKNTLDVNLQISTNVDDGFYGNPVISDDRKIFTYLVMPSVTQIITVQAKDFFAGKQDIFINPNKSKTYWVGTRESIEAAQKRESGKNAEAIAEAQRVKEAREDSLLRAQTMAPSTPPKAPQPPAPTKVEESKGGFPWLWVLGGVGLVGAGAVVLLGGGGGGGDTGTPTALPDLPSPPIRPTNQP